MKGNGTGTQSGVTVLALSAILPSLLARADEVIE